jgi:hypothetical protein
MTNKQLVLLNHLRALLLGSCHAPGCKKIRTCPRQCGCRSRREFKLNTETSICWEIADKLRNVTRWSKVAKKDLNEILAASQAYHDISRFHMTRGWQTFFLNLHRCLDSIINPRQNMMDYWKTQEEDRIDYLKSILKRLKRYPRS